MRRNGRTSWRSEASGVVHGPIVREVTGKAEFTNAQGLFWDVKSPVTPDKGESWIFDAQQQVDVDARAARARIHPAHRRGSASLTPPLS